MNPNIEPVIKWSGSKRLVAAQLARLFNKTDHFIDPFVGGGAILPYAKATRVIAGDIVPELISLWKCIQTDPQKVAEQYRLRWTRLQKEGHTAYYAIRDDFNNTRNPYDFLFLSRTCVNGLIRFNADGNFNNSLHHTRPGIAPERLSKILIEWSKYLSTVEFYHQDYRETLSVAGKGDMIFLDPPYAGTRGRYRAADFVTKEFYDCLEMLNKKGTHWVLTFDGVAGDRTYETGLNPTLYKHHLGIRTGNSTFNKVIDKRINAVIESVFLNFDPLPEALRHFTQFGEEPCMPLLLYSTTRRPLPVLPSSLPPAMVNLE
jgi:DNA adenine methylase